MTKKDYISIGNAIKKTKKQLTFTENKGDFINLLIEELNILFKKDNSSFNPERFKGFIERD